MSMPRPTAHEVARALDLISTAALTPEQSSRILELASRIADAPGGALSPDERTFGERLADAVARVGGSWGFLITFAVFMAVWVMSNTRIIDTRFVWDPYPYIFLNLMLSTLAAVQAPIIMMAQNRQTTRDRLEAERDAEVNRRAELEIRGLRDQLDRLTQRLDAPPATPA
jgi:uncharacterized membrane protein